MHHVSTGDNAKKGWHDLQLVVYMEHFGTLLPGKTATQPGSLALRRYRLSSGKGYEVRTRHYISQRLSLGIRNARAYPERSV